MTCQRGVSGGWKGGVVGDVMVGDGMKPMSKGREMKKQVIIHLLAGIAVMLGSGWPRNLPSTIR